MKQSHRQTLTWAMTRQPVKKMNVWDRRAKKTHQKKKKQHSTSSKPGRGREGDFGKYGESSLFLFCRLFPHTAWELKYLHGRPDPVAPQTMAAAVRSAVTNMCPWRRRTRTPRFETRGDGETSQNRSVQQLEPQLLCHSGLLLSACTWPFEGQTQRWVSVRALPCAEFTTRPLRLAWHRRADERLLKWWRRSSVGAFTAVYWEQPIMESA